MSTSAFGVEHVSKIAAMPVYHGTTKAGAKAIRRGKFVSMTGKERDGGMRNPLDLRPEGIYTTNDKRLATDFALSGRTPKRGSGAARQPLRGKVVAWNAVGVKPKYRHRYGDESDEIIYDLKSLGPPMSETTVGEPAPTNAAGKIKDGAKKAKLGVQATADSAGRKVERKIENTAYKLRRKRRKLFGKRAPSVIRRNPHKYLNDDDHPLHFLRTEQYLYGRKASQAISAQKALDKKRAELAPKVKTLNPVKRVRSQQRLKKLTAASDTLGKDTESLLYHGKDTRYYLSGRVRRLSERNVTDRPLKNI